MEPRGPKDWAAAGLYRHAVPNDGALDTAASEPMRALRPGPSLGLSRMKPEARVLDTFAASTRFEGARYTSGASLPPKRLTMPAAHHPDDPGVKRCRTALRKPARAVRPARGRQRP